MVVRAVKARDRQAPLLLCPLAEGAEPVELAILTAVLVLTEITQGMVELGHLDHLVGAAILGEEPMLPPAQMVMPLTGLEQAAAVVEEPMVQVQKQAARVATAFPVSS